MVPVADRPMPTSWPSTRAVSTWSPRASPSSSSLARVSALIDAGVALGQRPQLGGHVEGEADGVLDAQPGVLARELDGVHDLARHALLAQRVVDRRVEGHRAAALALDLVALRRAGLDEELLVGETELAAVDGQRHGAAFAQGGDQRGGVRLTAAPPARRRAACPAWGRAAAGWA